MTSTMRNFLIIGGVLATALFFFVLGIIGWQNDVISAEQGVLAQWRDNQNEYDSFWKKVKEVAQVPDKYKDDFKELLVTETQAKYGKDGSQATVQWLKDRNITFSDQMYVKIQNVIESGRNDFKRSQTELIDKQRVLTTEIRQFPGSLLSSILNVPGPVKGKYAPKEDIDGDGRLTVLDYPIVTSSKTEAVFESGKDDEELDVFSKKN